MINPEGKVYTRGKVVPSKKSLEAQGLDLSKDGELINQKTGEVVENEPEIEGYVCILDSDDNPTGTRVPIVARKFKKKFKFMPNGENTDCFTQNTATIITIKAKVTT